MATSEIARCIRLLLLFGLMSSCTSAKEIRAGERVIPVETLMKHSEKYNGKEVAVEGFLSKMSDGAQSYVISDRPGDNSACFSPGVHVEVPRASFRRFQARTGEIVTVRGNYLHQFRSGGILITPPGLFGLNCKGKLEEAVMIPRH